VARIRDTLGKQFVANEVGRLKAHPDHSEQIAAAAAADVQQAALAQRSHPAGSHPVQHRAVLACSAR